MKKESIISTGFLLLTLAVAIIMGLTVVSNAFQTLYSLSMSEILFTIIVLLLGFVVNVSLMEVAHILGAKVGKCKVVSVNLYFLCLKKTKNGWKFCIDEFDGLTGETKIVKTDKSRLNAYVWMPIVFYAAELAGCIVLYSIGGSSTASTTLQWLAIAALLWIILSSILFVYDFIPFKLDTMNDGYRLSLLTKPENAEALLDYMDYQGHLSLEDESKAIAFNENISDFTVDINLNVVEREVLSGNYEAALEMLLKMKNSEVHFDQYLRKRIVAQEMFVRLMKEPLEQVKEFYEKEVNDADRKFISNDSSIEALRAYVLIAGLIDDSQFEVQYAVSKKDKALKRCVKNTIESEKKLFDEVIKKIQEKHPDWKN